MSVRKKKNGKYQADVTCPVDGRIRPTFISHPDAVAWHNIARANIQQGKRVPQLSDTVRRRRPVKRTRHTVAMALLAAAKYKFEHHADPNQSYAYAGEVASSVGMDTDINAVTVSDIMDFQEAGMRKGNAEATLNRKVSCFMAVLAHARDRGWLLSTLKVPSLKIKATTHRVYTPDEYHLLLNTATQRPDLLQFSHVLRVLQNTGCRLGELTLCQPGDIKKVRPSPVAPGEWMDRFEWDIPAQNTKNGRARRIPLTHEVATSLDYIARYSPTNKTVKNDWAKLKRAVGWTGKGNPLHGWRHTHATRLLEAGVGIQVVSQLLGHSSIESTMIYGHVTDGSKREAVNKLEALNVRPNTGTETTGD